MGILSENEYFEMSKIVCLPFVSAPPSDRNTIYTVLKYVANIADEKGLTTCFVTFDQPLYRKSMEIVKSSPLTDNVSRVIPRLGGFHLLMSYLGSIGFIMDGSGLKDVLSASYAESSVDKMLQGHAYARAMRGHFLVYLSIVTKNFDDL